ncbi:PIR Superfamily Protein [Plasmodium ovale wallikeri]|uniref:PIR Superfamily Protein n=1 Tax=Plasmodium ovale wallikeri TaxID=864142 RepID=A0A1A9AI77_PLAOA|nr:PIR Superfamily Protein [Plasmodium ovale wallikeri]
MIFIKEHINSLPSYINYNRLDKNYKESGDIDHCTSLQSQLDGYEKFYEFCLNYTGILKNYDYWTLVESFNKDRCRTLKYWIYDYLFNRIVYKNSNSSSTDILNKILPRWIDKFPSNVCDIVPPPLKEDFNKEKKLYDYATNFDTIDHKLRDNGYKCTREAYVYLEEYVKQYKEIKQECDKTSNTKNYCTLLKTIHETYNDNKLSNLKCKNIEIYTPEESDFPVDRLGLGGEAQAYSRDEDTEELAMQQTSQFTGSHAFMATTFPIFGIILVLFILYKFTPFGPLVSSRFLKRKIIHDNIDEENMQELLTNAYELEDGNSNSSKNHISYYPL